MTAPVPTDVLRHLSDADAPMPGELLSITSPHSSDALVRTPLSAWRSHPAWCAAPDGHVLAPQDVGHGPSGGGVLVLHTPLRLRTLIDGRAAVTDAEAVTVCVSILRGASEADRLGIVEGAWWITATGRPLLAAGGEAPWRDQTAVMLADLEDGGSPKRSAAVRAARGILVDPRLLRRDLDSAEDALFAVSAPMPLLTHAVSRRVRALEGGFDSAQGRQASRSQYLATVGPFAPDADSASVRGSGPTAVGSDAAVSALHAVVRGQIDAEWADRLRAAWHGLRSARRRRQPRPRGGETARSRPRSRVVLVAGGVCATLIMVGLLLPADDASRADADAGERSVSTAVPPRAASPTRAPSLSPTSTPAGADSGESGIDSVVAALLERLGACARSGCPADVVESTERTFPPGPATTPASRRTITLVDDLGGVVVVRARARGEETEQMVVVVRREDEWLVRDVFDIADQP